MLARVFEHFRREHVVCGQKRGKEARRVRHRYNTHVRLLRRRVWEWKCQAFFVCFGIKSDSLYQLKVPAKFSRRPPCRRGRWESRPALAQNLNKINKLIRLEELREEKSWFLFPAEQLKFKWEPAFSLKAMQFLWREFLALFFDWCTRNHAKYGF